MRTRCIRLRSTSATASCSRIDHPPSGCPLLWWTAHVQRRAVSVAKLSRLLGIAGPLGDGLGSEIGQWRRAAGWGCAYGVPVDGGVVREHVEVTDPVQRHIRVVTAPLVRAV